jgi:hypothetical protein
MRQSQINQIYDHSRESSCLTHVKDRTAPFRILCIGAHCQVPICIESKLGDLHRSKSRDEQFRQEVELIGQRGVRTIGKAMDFF